MYVHQQRNAVESGRNAETSPREVKSNTRRGLVLFVCISDLTNVTWELHVRARGDSCGCCVRMLVDVRCEIWVICVLWCVSYRGASVGRKRDV